MKNLLLILFLVLTSFVKGQDMRPMYPADRTNRVFLSGLSSAITYSICFPLMNQRDGLKKHLYPLITTMGVNVCLGSLSYFVDRTNSVNKRQNITAWFGGSIVTVTILRIGLN